MIAASTTKARLTRTQTGNNTMCRSAAPPQPQPRLGRHARLAFAMPWRGDEMTIAMRSVLGAAAFSSFALRGWLRGFPGVGGNARGSASVREREEGAGCVGAGLSIARPGLSASSASEDGPKGRAWACDPPAVLKCVARAHTPPCAARKASSEHPCFTRCVRLLRRRQRQHGGGDSRGGQVCQIVPALSLLASSAVRRRVRVTPPPAAQRAIVRQLLF
eukprot:358392-Chlamydomonas_euryale.AAC.3